MNKVIVAILSIIVILSAIFLGIRMYDNRNKGIEEENQVQVESELSKEVTDECVEEWEEMQEEAKQDMLQANSNEIKVSPNSMLMLKTYFKDCKHTSKQYLEMPDNLVNCSEQEVKEKYQKWQLEKFSKNEVVMYREEEGECNEHYVIKEQEGKIVVFQIDSKGEEVEYEKTEIATEYLTETDKIHLKSGWKVFGKESLNQVIEDFE